MPTRSLGRFVPALLRASAEAMAVVDADGRLDTTDERLLGVVAAADESALRALTFRDLFPDLNLADAAQAGGDFNPVQLCRLDGARVWVLLKVVPLPPPDQGQVLLLIQEPSAVRRIVDRLDYVEDHDPTTGFFSRNHGLQQLKQLVASGTPGCCVLVTLKSPQSEPLDRAAVETQMHRIVGVCRELEGFEPLVARNDFNELLLLSLHPQPLAAAADRARFKQAIAATVPPGPGALLLETGITSWADPAPSTIAILDAVRLDQLASASAARQPAGDAYQRDILRALRSGELVFHIEPQVSADDGQVHGAELLVRWQHPERGLIFPGQFIDQLEDPACSGEFVRWSIEAAIAMAAQLRDRLGTWFPLSLNISGSGFNDELLQLIRERAAEAGMPPSMLELEITERLIAEDGANTLRCLQDLHTAGFRIAVDDFGTGYSSLSYIRNFPLDRLKVDRAFVLGISESEEDRLITTAIISLSHVLGLGVVVEGVETAEQASILRELGAETFQGYLFGRAQPLESFVELVRSRQPKAEALDFSGLQQEQIRRFDTIVWKRTYSTDVVSVDDEHRSLIDLLNRLTRALQESPDSLDVPDALDRLASETSRHFAHEELVMANIGYDRLTLHRSKHQALLQEFLQRRDTLLQQYKAGDFEELIAYLKFWLLNHLMSEDTRLHRFLNRVAPAVPAAAPAG